MHLLNLFGFFKSFLQKAKIFLFDVQENIEKLKVFPKIQSKYIELDEYYSCFFSR